MLLLCRAEHGQPPPPAAAHGRPPHASFSTAPPSCRALSLLGEAARLFLLLEDDSGAAHCRYLSALLQDALGQTEQRDAAAAAFRALQLSAAA